MSDIEKQIAAMVDQAVSQKMDVQEKVSTKEKKKTQMGDDYWTFSKILGVILLVFSMSIVAVCVPLVAMGLDGLVPLGQTAFTGGIVTLIGLLGKGFWETKEQEKVKLEYAKLDAKTVEMANGSPTVEENVAG